MGVVIAVLAAAMCLTASPVSGHAYVETSSPSDAATVGPPREVMVRFTEKVELEFSTVVVKSQTGEAMNAGKVRQPAPDTLAVDLKTLPPGTYVIEWRVLSIDTHVTSGAMKFTVAAPRR